jgi:NSS family neurotransmitter:Na+ symporter
MAGTESRHGMWSNRWLFVMAAAGSAVGLGNIWKFPYIAGENGGGAFVLLYLLCVGFVGIPIMMAEVLIGREGRQSPINTMRALTQLHHRNPLWGLIGWMGVIAGFLILSYYAVIAGWALYYILRMADGTFVGATSELATSTFDAFLADPWQLILWQTIFMAATVWIISHGVIKGIERAIRWFMPMLFILLMVLLGYAVNSDGFAQGWDFMFGFNWSALNQGSVLVAMGQAFFTLSLGMGAIMAYGAYLPSGSSITSTVIIIALLDTVVAIAAGLAIFPIVFANGLEAGQGPGLMFVTLPLAFGQMPFGVVFGTLFFVLVSFAAITSAISISEPALAYLVEQYNAKRSRVAISLGVISWILGIGSVLSFNHWADVHIVGQLTFFDFVDYVSQNIMLPLGGVLISLFAAFALPNTVIGNQLGLRSPVGVVIWKLLCGVVAPIGVLAVFAVSIGLDDLVYRVFGGAAS